MILVDLLVHGAARLNEGMGRCDVSRASVGLLRGWTAPTGIVTVLSKWCHLRANGSGEQKTIHITVIYSLRIRLRHLAFHMTTRRTILLVVVPPVYQTSRRHPFHSHFPIQDELATINTRRKS